MVDWKTVNPVTGNHLRPQAFMRRAPHPDTGGKRDTRGLSVTLANGRSEATVIDDERGRFAPRAICTLTVADVHSIAGTPVGGAPVYLTVEPDAPKHANIVGLPEIPEDPPTTPEARRAIADAEYLGGKLASLATVVWRKP